MSAASARLRSAGAAAFIVCATFLAYLPSLTGAFIWNDSDYVTAPALRSFAGLGRIWTEIGATQQYYPLLHSAFWIQHRLWGDHPLGYHIVTLTLHAGGAVLFAFVLRRLAVPGAWLAALLFALHPVHVESVAWITEQKNTLSLVFYLAAARCYLDFDETRRPRTYAAALVLFVLSLLCKTVTATLPAALLVVFWWKRGRIRWREDARPLIPWLALGAAAGVLSSWVEKRYIGAQGADFDLSFLGRVLVAGRAVWFYAGKLAWPADLNFVYRRWIVDTADPWQWLFPLATAGVAAALWAVRRRSRAPLAVFLIFLGTLFPVLGFVNLFGASYSWVWDHWQYLADLAPLALAAAAIATVWSRVAPRAPWPGPAFVAALSLLLGGLAWRHCSMFSDDQTLYRSTMARNPDCWLAHNNLGVLLVDVPGRLPEAISEFEEALRVSPNDARSHRNRGKALARIPGRLTEAISEIGEAVRINPADPESHNDLGNVLSKDPGRLTEAVAQYREALRIKPGYAAAHYNLGLALANMPGHLDDSISEYRATLQLTPNDPEAHNNLGIALAKIPGRLTDAVSEYEAALRIKPDYPEAHFNLGIALANIPGRMPDAIAHLRETLRMTPDDPEAHNSLAILLAHDPGRLAEAVEHYEAALRLRPEFAEAHFNLGCALGAIPGRMPDAAAQFEDAVKLRPDYAEAHFNLGLALARIPGRVPEAVAQFEEVLRIRPDFLPARQMLDRFRP